MEVSSECVFVRGRKRAPQVEVGVYESSRESILDGPLSTISRITGSEREIFVNVFFGESIARVGITKKGKRRENAVFMPLGYFLSDRPIQLFL